MPWPRSQERRARGFPPAPSLTRDRRPIGFQPLLPRLLSGPPSPHAFPGPSPHARRARSRARLARGARACDGGRAEGCSAAGASAQAPSWDRCRRESQCAAGGGVRGREPGVRDRAVRVGRGRWLPTRRDPTRSWRLGSLLRFTPRAASRPIQPSLQFCLGVRVRGDGGGSTWLERLGSLILRSWVSGPLEKVGRNVKRGHFCKKCSTPWVFCPPWGKVLLN